MVFVLNRVLVYTIIDMKKIFLLTLGILVFSVVSVDAEVVASKEKEVNSTNFKLTVSDIVYYKDIKKTQFLVNIEEINNSQNIAYWKVRSYCDQKMTIQLSASSTDDCNKTIRLNSITNNVIPFLFKNKTSKSKDFSIKVKAYNKFGKGLHYEKIGFGWK